MWYACRRRADPARLPPGAARSGPASASSCTSWRGRWPRTAIRHGRGDQLAILTTSWKDRPVRRPRGRTPGRRDRRSPRPGAGADLGVEPPRLAAGRMAARARADVVHAQTPLLIPSRTRRRWSRFTICTSCIIPNARDAEMRRDFPALVHDARAARRSDRRVVAVRRRRGRAAARRARATRVTVCSPGAPALGAGRSRGSARAADAGLDDSLPGHARAAQERRRAARRLRAAARRGGPTRRRWCSPDA